MEKLRPQCVRLFGGSPKYVRTSPKVCFPEEEEKLLDDVSAIHARQGTVLSRQDFIELASISAERDEVVDKGPQRTLLFF